MSTPAIAQSEFPAIIPGSVDMFPRPARSMPRVIRRAASVILDGLTLLAVILCIPFVVLIVGSPIVLLVQLLLWIGRVL